MPSSFAPRQSARPDACPGIVRLHRAADGLLARVRLPGGALTAAQLQAIAVAAQACGNGALELTARGNIQLRGIADPEDLASRLTSAGLLPSPAHDRIRNIAASPLSGRAGGLTDIRPLVAQLDAGLAAAAVLARLPGRILFGLDDGRGDVASLDPDIGLLATSATEFALLLAGRRYDLGLSYSRSVPTVLAAATVFAAIADGHWRLRDVPHGPSRVLAALRHTRAAPHQVADPPVKPIVGWIAQDDGLVSLAGGLRFGAFDARTAEFLAVPGVPLSVTPWRTVIVHDLPEDTAEQVVRVLAPLGLIFDDTSPWLRVTACTGRPGCEKALADVRADAASAVQAGEVTGSQHWAGCQRQCGRPRGPVTAVVANPGGYAVYPAD